MKEETVLTNKEKIKLISESDELMKAVKILIAAMQELTANNYIRFAYDEQVTGGTYELTFMKLGETIEYKNEDVNE